MTDLGITTIYVGGVPAVASPAKEYVAGGTGFFGPHVKQVLPRGVDDVTADFGVRTYEAMLTDSSVGGSFSVLRLSILADGWSLRPARVPKPGEEPTPEDELSAEIHEFCGRALASIEDRTLDETLDSMLLALAYGNRLAEKTYKAAEHGPDAGKLVLKSIKVKPREAWAFVVDGFRNVVGILATAPNGSTSVVERGKFALLTWRGKDDDPRGSSILRQAYSAWNLKTQMWPHFYKYLTRFGTPGLVGEVGPDATPRPPTDAELVADPTLTEVYPEQDMLTALSAFENATAVAVANGAKVYPIQAQGNGEAFRAAVELFNREIVGAILLQHRATMEAQHGSKADSQTGQDILGCFVRFVRRCLGGMVDRDILRHLVTINYGEAVAAEHTPIFTLGGVEQQDFSDVAKAVAVLKSSGYLDPSQYPELDARLGLPTRDPDSVPDEPTDPNAVEADAEEEDAVDA